MVLSGDKKRQGEYLLRVYYWYFNKLKACGAMSQEQQEEEDKFINPEKYEQMQKERDEEVAKKKLQIQNED